MFKPEPTVKMFYDALDAGKFMGKKCPTCGNVEFPPYNACNECGHIGTEWYEISGNAVVTELFRVPPMNTTPELQPYAPLFGVEVELEEGTELCCLCHGITNANYEHYRDNVPFPVKMVVQDMGDFNTYAVSLTGEKPVRAGKVEANEEYLKSVSGMQRANDSDYADQGKK